jgi:Piwi domain
MNFLGVMDKQLKENGIFQSKRYVECENCTDKINPGSCHVIPHQQIRDKKTLNKTLRHFKEKEVNIVFVILPDKNPATYAMVKKVADVDVGIHTTCIVRNPGWFRGKKGHKGPVPELKCDLDAATNILLKVNLRLGGDNLILANTQEGQLFTRETIILGADVTHPGIASQKECRSVAAVVGTIDPEFNLYSASIRCQAGKQEHIAHFGDMVGERLDLWKARNAPRYPKNHAQLPKQLIIFRDGVSESQFQMILRSEWPQIQAVVRARYSANHHQPLPKVMLMCVLKRHGTRFFPVEQRDRDQNGNPSCGLVVASGVTYENAYDFYLQSHACVQGTARPAHYVVLVDEVGLARSVVQKEVSRSPLLSLFFLEPLSPPPLFPQLQRLVDLDRPSTTASSTAAALKPLASIRLRAMLIASVTAHAAISMIHLPAARRVRCSMRMRRLIACMRIWQGRCFLFEGCSTH